MPKSVALLLRNARRSDTSSVWLIGSTRPRGIRALVRSSLDEAILDNRSALGSTALPELDSGRSSSSAFQEAQQGRMYQLPLSLLSSARAARPNTWKEAPPPKNLSDHTQAGFVGCVGPISPASPRGPKLPRKERRGGALLHHQLPVLQSPGRPSDADFFNPRLVTGPTLPTVTSLSLRPQLFHFTPYKREAGGGGGRGGGGGEFLPMQSN